MSDGHRRDGNGNSHRLPDYLLNATDEQRERAKAFHDGPMKTQIMRDPMALALDMIVCADRLAEAEQRIEKLKENLRRCSDEAERRQGIIESQRQRIAAMEATNAD